MTDKGAAGVVAGMVKRAKRAGLSFEIHPVINRRKWLLLLQVANATWPGKRLVYIGTDDNGSHYMQEEGNPEPFVVSAADMMVETLAEQRARRAQLRKCREQVMRDMGMTKVKGNLGGTYWE